MIKRHLIQDNVTFIFSVTNPEARTPLLDAYQLGIYNGSTAQHTFSSWLNESISPAFDPVARQFALIRDNVHVKMKERQLNLRALLTNESDKVY